MSLLISRCYKNLKEKEEEEEKKLSLIHQKIRGRAVDFIEELEKNETAIKINKRILGLKFFDELLNYLYKTYLELDFYESLLLEALATNDKSQEQCVLIEIEKLEYKVTNLYKKFEKRFVFLFVVILICFGV